MTRTISTRFMQGPRKKRNKFKWTARTFPSKSVTQFITRTNNDFEIVPLSTLATASHELHRTRRAALNPFFSKSNVGRLQPIVQNALANLLERFDLCSKAGEITPFILAVRATTTDVITECCFDKSTGYINWPDYNVSYYSAIDAVFQQTHWLLHLGVVGTADGLFTHCSQSQINPGLGSLYKIREVSELKSGIRAHSFWLTGYQPKPGMEEPG